MILLQNWQLEKCVYLSDKEKNVSNVMVINMGMKSIRCIIFDSHGVKLGSAACPISTAINDNQVEQNPVEWTQKAEKVMQQALWEAGKCRIDYVTITASASCLICVDKDGKPLCNAYMVSDKRAEKEAEEIQNLPEFETVRKQTQTDMSASLMLPKILWVKKNLPDIFSKTMYFLSPDDFMMSFLSGEYVTDYFNAVKYHYNLSAKMYPMKLLKVLGISCEKLPKVVDIGTDIGVIRGTLAEKLGISKEARVVVSSYDAICSLIGSGVSEEGEASDVSGTVTVFRAFTKKNSLIENSQIYQVPLFRENAQIVGGSNNLGGGLIEWVKQCYYQKEEYPYEVMEKEAGESEIGARGLVFLPYLLGERAPLWNDNARGVFFGIERMHTRKDMTRAVFESTGFIDRDMMAAVEKTGVEIRKVRLSGGLARLNLISQIKSDIMGRDVEVLAEFETTALGAAMIVLLGKGEYPDLKTIAVVFVKIRMIIKPDTEKHKIYENMYHLYQDTYKTLQPLFVRRKQVLEKIRSDREVKIENL